MSRTPAYDEAYPRALWHHERAHLHARRPRRGLPANRPSDEVVGIALSGGGIRSATFCLGVFQALAGLGQLSRVDYISTVSGGGYFGSFLGRLYRRRPITSAEQVRALLDPAAPSSERPAEIPDVVAWLRENGRYLAERGRRPADRRGHHAEELGDDPRRCAQLRPVPLDDRTAPSPGCSALVAGPRHQPVELDGLALVESLDRCAGSHLPLLGRACGRTRGPSG
jgi:hypothetical protein